VLAAKAALAGAEKSRNTVAIAAAKEAVKAAEAKAEETSAGKAAGGESAAPALAPPTRGAAAHILGQARSRGSPRASSWCRAGPRVCEAGSELFWCFCLCCALLATASPATRNC